VPCSRDPWHFTARMVAAHRAPALLWLALGAIMALEKNAPWGRRLSRPLGFALLGWAAILTVVNTA
jgi:predicted metal-binding membrane protein